MPIRKSCSNSLQRIYVCSNVIPPKDKEVDISPRFGITLLSKPAINVLLGFTESKSPNCSINLVATREHEAPVSIITTAGVDKEDPLTKILFKYGTG